MTQRVFANGISINACIGGAGPPLLLLHGHPQTHVMWHRVAPVLAERFTVVCPDLRGYGDSDKPFGGQDHADYSKRTMALDQLEVMRQVGFERFGVAAHDRGARVALRMALDHPEAVSELAILDIVPTVQIYASLDKDRATTVWRYFFLVQPYDRPERLISADRQGYLRCTLDEWCGTPRAVSDAALAKYLRSFDLATVHVSCEDYRAGATIDLEHDAADSSKKLECPTLVLWSASGIGSAYDVLGIWSERASNLRGVALECGHFIAEERAAETADELLRFFGSVSVV